MSAPSGFIELERAVESIQVGRRHRTDLGDLASLAASIDRDGLLQPITITPDGVLVCGARRLAAITRLGWKSVNVWVRSGLSDRLGQLMAEQDDNTLHKPLTQLEAASLYRELKQVMTEDAARRQSATQFSTDNQPGKDGPAKFAGPSTSLGETRQQAAAMIPGGASHTTLEKIGYLQQITEDPSQAEEMRHRVAAQLDRIADGAPVDPIYQTVRQTIKAAQETHDTDLDRLAREAIARATASKTKSTAKPKTRSPGSGPTDDALPIRYPVRAFIVTWTELADWWTHYDVDVLAAELSDEQIDLFLHIAEATSLFAERLRTAGDNQNNHEGPAVRPQLRAL